MDVFVCTFATSEDVLFQKMYFQGTGNCSLFDIQRHDLSETFTYLHSCASTSIFVKRRKRNLWEEKKLDSFLCFSGTLI